MVSFTHHKHTCLYECKENRDLRSVRICVSMKKKTGQARVRFVHREFSTKIGGLGLFFLKFRLSLARVLSFDNFT